MNRNEFIDFLLEKGKCNRFDEHQIDSIEQFCFALYDNTDLSEQKERIEKLTARVKELTEALQYVHDDLLLRADTDDDGCKVVNLGYGCWLGVKSALDKGDL